MEQQWNSRVASPIKSYKHGKHYWKTFQKRKTRGIFHNAETASRVRRQGVMPIWLQIYIHMCVCTCVCTCVCIHITQSGRLPFPNARVSTHPFPGIKNPTGTQWLQWWNAERELALPIWSIYSSLPLFFCATFYTSLKQTTDVLQQTNIVLGKDSETGRNSALACKSHIFILHLQLLVHIYISICIPIFIKT